ncbi:MAG: hypothetical protein LBB04_02580 [Oscillospiraceae bacterium]|jgi:hypothetical protein|nr:hypothetical protein [Oscillospiraceae bacterium]
MDCFGAEYIAKGSLRSRGDTAWWVAKLKSSRGTDIRFGFGSFGGRVRHEAGPVDLCGLNSAD